MRLLVVEDDERTSALVCAGLRKHGFACDPAVSLRDATDAMRNAEYDAIVLDRKLPDGDGVEWLVQRGDHAARPPVVVITARGEPAERIAGLDAGADDYLVKPFELEELAARLRALLRRPGSRNLPVLELGSLRLDVSRRSAYAGKIDLKLAPRELAMLELLLRRPGIAVSKAVITGSLYCYDEPVTTNAVEALASRIRQKLEVAGVGGMFVTRRGVGYLLQEISI